MARTLGIGGTERQLCEIARNLDRTQFEPHAGCFHAEGFRAEELQAAGVPILQLPVRSFHRPGALAGWWQLGRYIRRHQIAIVHTFDTPLNGFGAPAARAFRVPLVLTSQRAHRSLAGFTERCLLRLSDLVTDGIVVNSQAVRRDLIENQHIAASRIHLCYNGIDTAHFQPGPRCRPEVLGGARLVIGVVCALRPEKDLATLVEAFARVRRSQAGLKLVLVGSGPARQELMERCAQLGIREDCHFEPATADVLPWLHAIDIFVLPSRSEALSNALMEAMACGCAVAASEVGGNPELVEHGRTGLLFPAGDAAGLAACLERLAGDDELREGLGEAGAAFIRERFPLAAAAQRMGEIYEGLLRWRNTTVPLKCG